MRSITSRPRAHSRRKPDADIEPSGNAIAAATASRSGVLGSASLQVGSAFRIFFTCRVNRLCAPANVKNLRNQFAVNSIGITGPSSDDLLGLIAGLELERFANLAATKSWQDCIV